MKRSISFAIGRILLIFIALFALACGVGPILYNNFHIGAWACTGFGGALLLLTLIWNKFCTPDGKPVLWWKRVRALGVIGISCATAVGTVLSALMFHAAFFTPPHGENTVVVLGCQVRGTEPSLMLQYRLDAALRYLDENPDTKVVCSGGLGENTIMSEAAVMEKYLISKGVSPDRIFLEDRSTSTEENLAFSAEIIQAEQLPLSVAIATDSFHEYRGALYAKRAGLHPSAIPGKTPWGLFPSYWVREWFGILKTLVA